MTPTTSTTPRTPTPEKLIHVLSGWPMLALNLGLLLLSIAAFVRVIVTAPNYEPSQVAARILGTLLLATVASILLAGHFTLQPNEARVLILFGDYKGTVRDSGFHWANPFYARERTKVTVHPPQVRMEKTAQGGERPVPVEVSRHTKMSLRMHNFMSDRLKVNDKRGNPVEIAAVVVWRVDDTARAAFDVEDYESYVQTQSESAVRQIASLYAYDHGEEQEPTLRESGDAVANALRAEVQARLDRAGIAVEEVRLTHLAYAPEIAQVMLRRQQAEAVIAARTQIVHGAVSMVEMALKELAEKEIINLDDERRAAMVSNLLVVLCSESETSPVINAGTLY
jgi:regulator of protease activity HflC (stomatin/prohibitin superfamily)